jgi:hypothetical protein
MVNLQLGESTAQFLRSLLIGQYDTANDAWRWEDAARLKAILDTLGSQGITEPKPRYSEEQIAAWRRRSAEGGHGPGLVVDTGGVDRQVLITE